MFDVNILQMPIWSLTQERVDKLKAQMVSKKEEHDVMEKLSEKDLWCQDLDAFIKEWETQLKEEDDYQKSIRNTNRRASRKIGAGKNFGKAKKGDDDYAPKAAKPKIVTKPAAKTHQRFTDMFAGSKAKPKPKSSMMGSDGADDAAGADSGLSDDDFENLKPMKQESRAPSEQPAAIGGRAKRAAAAAPKKWVIEDDESESDDDKLLGDVGDMVKGIGGGNAANKTNGRVSLFAMSRPDSSHGRSTSNDLPKMKSKPSKTFDFSDEDETNYEMLAKSSPQKAPPAPKDTLDIDSFLSVDEDDDIMPLPKKAAPAKAPVKAVAKRGPKPKVAAKASPPAKKAPEPEPAALSPQAKAYAAKKSKLMAKKDVFSDEDEDEDVVMDDNVGGSATAEDDSDESLPPKPAARGRPARAAAVVAKTKTKTQPIYLDSDDEDEMDVDDVDDSAIVEEEPSEDDFDESE